ncbi:MAG: aspartate carbamoyltransferase, partial [Candidatus Korobacteraceae bacterium]
MKPQLHSLLGIEQLTTAQIESILALARRMDPSRPSQLLRGKRVALLFYESSTRTRTSFEFAAKTLGAATTLVTPVSSSIEKGESLIDTGWTVANLGADAIVMRHANSGAAYLLARYVRVPIVNAGDGMHQHPSQALLDALTITNHKKRLNGLRVVIVGDVYHSRVARSNAELLSRFDADIVFCGPPDFVPEISASLAPGVTACHDLNIALQGADVVMA